MKRPFISPHKLPAVFALVGAMMLGGMVAGDAIGSVPMLAAEADGLGSDDAIASDADANWRPSERPMNDQFAVTTPDGRFAVSELSQRGLYSQRRFGGGARATEQSAWNQWEAQDAAIRREMAYWERQDAARAQQAAELEAAQFGEQDAAIEPALENGVEVTRGSAAAESEDTLGG